MTRAVSSLLGRRPSTARNAFDHSYNVVLVVDAMTDRNPDAHRHSVETIFPRIGETTTTDDVLAQLKGAGVMGRGAGRPPRACASGPKGRETLAQG